MGKNKYKKSFRQRRRLELISALGGECIVCGTNERLEFDHIFPEDKSFDISARLDYSMSNLLRELQKCQLLCRRHNIEKMCTDNGIQAVPLHGRISTYTNHKCRCRKCKDAWSIYFKKQRLHKAKEV